MTSLTGCSPDARGGLFPWVRRTLNPVHNPYEPGAGSEPPELAGRGEVIDLLTVSMQRVAAGKSTQSPVLVGLRGVGKTVLLVRMETLGKELDFKVIRVEACEGKSLPELLIPGFRSALLELSLIESAKDKARRSLGVLKAFIAGFGLAYAGIEITYDPTAGVADTGDIESDLPDLVIELAEAAKAAGKAIAIIVDELQILKPEEFSALIMSIHRVSQAKLPVAFIGAGLPQVTGIAGDAKSYAERLFRFVNIGALAEDDAVAAIEHPAAAMNVTFEPGAISEILRATERYPYFLQQWAHDAWNIAQDDKLITWSDVLDATDKSHKNLDESFFRVRYDRCNASERKYMRALAELGPGVHRNSDVAGMMGIKVSGAGPIRGKLIKKGMIYSPSLGDVCFSVPLFDQFMCRLIPDFVASSRG